MHTNLKVWDSEKAGIFGERMSEIFADRNDPSFDDHHKRAVEAEVINRTRATNSGFVPVNMVELKKNISRLKLASAPGPDGITNEMLKHLPVSFLYVVLELINVSLFEGVLPDDWKSARINMIPKKGNSSCSPDDYRPISLTSCLGKLVERIISHRLYLLLDTNKFFKSQQAGFRKNRSTSDNIVFLTQKIEETFARKKKLGCIFFDIAKAFDSVWHRGLIFKLLKANVDPYIVNWVENFLKDRSFFVEVNGSKSDVFLIESGVPQGAALSPLLFCVYFNDIPTTEKRNESGSLLFADDLATCFIYNKNGNIKAKIKSYMLKFENWLSKWRMKASATKCSYCMFSGNGKADESNLVYPELYGQRLLKDNYPKFLG